jgi:hypothetical protein
VRLDLIPVRSTFSEIKHVMKTMIKVTSLKEAGLKGNEGETHRVLGSL